MYEKNEGIPQGQGGKWDVLAVPFSTCPVSPKADSVTLAVMAEFPGSPEEKLGTLGNHWASLKTEKFGGLQEGLPGWPSFFWQKDGRKGGDSVGPACPTAQSKRQVFRIPLRQPCSQGRGDAGLCCSLT